MVNIGVEQGCVLAPVIFNLFLVAITLAFHIPQIYTQTFECLLHFFQLFRAPTEKAVGPIFALNTSCDVVLRKEVPFGVRKINFKI